MRRSLNDESRKKTKPIDINLRDSRRLSKKTPIKSYTEKKVDADGFSFVTRFSQDRNGSTSKISPIPYTRASFSSPALDYSIRLDDKQKYKELLDNVANGTFNDSSIYGTPLGSLSGYNLLSRGKKLIELSKSPRQRAREVIDLTSDSKTKLNKKDIVNKVLDDFDSKDLVILDDSDSDVEILPTPPSPKPDIRVDPVNSLKPVINTSKATQSKWLNDL